VNRERVPSVSAVIPAYNAVETLLLAVASAVSQDLKPREVIVVDDGSSDGTSDLVQRLAEVDPAVRLLRQRENSGPAAARRAGVEASSGELVAFLDADDAWLPGKLSSQAARLTQLPGVAGIHGGAVFVDEDLRPLRYYAAEEKRNTFADFLCWKNMPCVTGTLLARREVLTDDLFFDDLAAIEDWAMMVKLASEHRVAALHDALVLYRVRSGSRSQSLDPHIQAGNQVLERARGWGMDSALERQAYAALYVMLCGGALRLGDQKATAAWAMRALRRDPRSLTQIIGVFGRRVRDRRRLLQSGLSPAVIESITDRQLATLGLASSS
jgi:glycosyltransferase involved in cell wall biosynthesis